MLCPPHYMGCDVIEHMHLGGMCIHCGVANAIDPKTRKYSTASFLAQSDRTNHTLTNPYWVQEVTFSFENRWFILLKKGAGLKFDHGI